MTPAKVAVLAYLLAGTIFMAVAIMPLFREEKLNVTFFTLGIVFLVLGAALVKRARGESPSKSDHRGS